MRPSPSTNTKEAPTCGGHLLAEEHEVDLVEGDVVQGAVVLDVAPQRRLPLVQITPVRQPPARAGAGGRDGAGLHDFIAYFSETLNSIAHHSQVTVLRSRIK